MIDTIVQQALFARLSAGALAGRVFDDVPQAAIAPDSLDPLWATGFVTIGDDTVTAWDTDDSTGATVVARVHSWSRHRGRQQIKELQGEIHARLHRAGLEAAGWVFVTCDFVQSFSMVDQDGLTRHGVSEFRILLERGAT